MEINNDVDLIGEYFGDSYAEQRLNTKQLDGKD